MLVDCLQLGDGLRQFGFGGGVADVGGARLQRFLGTPLGLEGLGFVEVVGADRGVGEQGDQRRLHFEDAARDIDELLFVATRNLQAHGSRLDAGQ